MAFSPEAVSVRNPDLNPSHSGSVFRLAARLLPLWGRRSSLNGLDRILYWLIPTHVTFG